MKQSPWALFGLTVVLTLSLLGFEGRAEALTVGALDFTSGAVNLDGRHGRILDRLFAEDGSITIGSYQSMTEIVDPIAQGHKSFSLFTSGLNGAAAPSVRINGDSISVDLSSLYLGETRGDEIRIWNIGGMAKGLFNPQTSEFCFSWEHLFRERNHHWNHDQMGDRSATFFLQGTAVGAQSPVPLSTSLIFFAIGLILIGGLFWRKSAPVPSGELSH